MILVDYNLISIQCCTGWCFANRDQTLTLDIATTLIRNRLHKYEFQNFGKMVLCCDSRSYWRKKAFPGYKYKRKAARDATTKTNNNVDWDLIHKAIDVAKKNNPYKVIEVDGAEADDIIAVLTKEFHTQEEIAIISSDGDFYQLHKYKSVIQHIPKHGIWMNCGDDALIGLREKIIRGDLGDSIPNFQSPDDTYTAGKKNRCLNNDEVPVWREMEDFLEFCDTPERVHGYKRNRLLIDFDYIPPNIKAAILTEFYGKN